MQDLSVTFFHVYKVGGSVILAPVLVKDFLVISCYLLMLRVVLINQVLKVDL